MSQVINYPLHKEAVLQNDYIVKIRPLGEPDWIRLPLYKVKVNMHEVHDASMGYFNFSGKVEVEIAGPWYIYQADIRPYSKEIKYTCDTKKVHFILEEPVNLSIELNKDRNRNLHLFAGKSERVEPDKQKEDVLVIKGDLNKLSGFGEEVVQKLTSMPKGRTLYIEPGIHYIGECVLKLPSDTNVFLEGGCIVIGAFVCEEVENVHIFGDGIIYQADFARFSGINGIRVSHSQNISISDIIFINPPHYTVFIGASKNITISNIKTFSCEGWSDGIDIMSSQNIEINNCFLRTSDDCVAIYGSRWKYLGDSKNIRIHGMVLWADVAHPINMGTHGNYEEDGDIIEDIRFWDIDILEHNEYQAGYLGCMAINVGDKNTARNIIFQNIRIETISHGKLLDVQVKYNPDYNPAPGKGIENIRFEDIFYQGRGEVTSEINGFNCDFIAESISLQNVIIRGKKAEAFEEANIRIGEFTKDITIC